MSTSIVVTGATGHLGPLIIERLIARGTAPADIVAAGRNPERLAAVARLGVSTAVVDFASPASLDSAFASADTLMLVSGSEVGQRIQQHANAISAAARSGVTRIVYTSAPHADTSALVIAPEHKATEQALLDSGISFSILRNNWYTENYLSSMTQAARSGTYADSTRGGLVASASRIDFADAAAVVLTTDGHENTTYELGGDYAWDGSELAAECVVSNADPRSTLLGLLGARHLEAEFARRIEHLRTGGTAAKLHLALAGMPGFKGVTPSQCGERLVIAPNLDYIERAFNPAKYGASSEQPVFEIVMPSVHDSSMAPAGCHVLSAIVQYAPYDLRGGWPAGRDAFMAASMAVLEQYAPGIGALVKHAELLTPADIEQQYHITGGHWHHGELALDQFMMLRPVPGAAQYAMPVDGLYLCGAGCHPGGGVMGSAGRNAARVMLGKR